MIMREGQETNIFSFFFALTVLGLGVLAGYLIGVGF